MYIFLTGGHKDGSLYNIISLLLMFVLVLFLAYWTAKLAGKLQGNPMNKKANIKVIDSIRLGGNKFISIVKIGENYYALGFGKDEITMIDRLDNESFQLPDEPVNEDKKSFKDIISGLKIQDQQDNIDKK